MLHYDKQRFDYYIEATEMIQENEKDKVRSWQQALADIVTNPLELLDMLGLQPDHVGLSELACAKFECRVPREFIAKMRHGDPTDPLLLQVLPSQLELEKTPGFVSDPLGEKKANPLPGLLHKYHGRILLTLAGSCAINCRYCFRREFSYSENNPGLSGWQKTIDYVSSDTSISEVIYSGGDPLLLKDDVLQSLSEKFAAIEHVRTLRIHTRLPVVIPQRITDEFCNWLQALRLKIVVVIHCNHPNEIDVSLQRALKKLSESGVTILNQSVLLNNINDDAFVLKALSEKLFSCSVLPYYLHVLDKVSGAAHFDVEEARAIEIHEKLQHILPGYLVPKLVREVAGEKSKSVVHPTTS